MMPAPGTAWPPAPLAPVFDAATESAAWWEGDASALGGMYHGKVRPSQYQGGVVGATSRFFWGKPPADGGKRLHLPLAADLAHTSATLLFDTPPNIHLADDGGNDAARQRLDLIFNGDRFAADLLVGAESCAALGGVFWRIMWDQTITETPWVDFVDTDSAIPEWRHGRLVSLTVVEELDKQDDKYVYRLLSRYVPGAIEYRLFRGKDNNLGDIIPLGDHPATEPLSGAVNADSMVPTGGQYLAAGYIPNALPNVGFRRSGLLRNYGRSDLSPDLYPLFDLLDETWTSLQRELRIGKGRMTIPEYMTRSTGKLGQGVEFRVDDEFFIPVNSHPDSNVGPQVHQPDLRIEEHLALSEGIIRQVLNRANYSHRSFGMGNTGSGPQTAREIEADMQASIQTWRAKSRYWRAGITDMAHALLEIDADLNRTGAKLTAPVIVDMVPPVQENDYDRALTLQALDAARAISTDEKVAYLRPDWADQRRQDEVAKILAEQSGVVADPWLGAAPDDEATVDSPDDMKKRADAMAVMIRAGVESSEAARLAGIDNVKFTGGRPITLKYDSEG